MPDKKLTDAEIKNALEEHYKQVDKGYSTHLEYGGRCDEHEEKYIYMLRDVLDLINSLQDKNKAYKYYYDEFLKDLKKANAENEKLKKAVDIHKGIAEDWKYEAKKLQMAIGEVDDHIYPLPFETDYDKAIKQAKAEAVKEFAEKYKAEINEQYGMMEYHVLYLDAIDHVLERIDVNYE